MKKGIIAVLLFAASGVALAQSPLKKVYNESIDRMEQVDNALVKATNEGKNVLVQLGGNWCVWCLRFADFIERDAELKAQMDANYEYIHVDYSPTAKRLPDHKTLMRRLGNPVRFGFPVLVVLDAKGRVLHLQDSSFLEKDKGYDKKRVQRFLSAWTPKAMNDLKE